SSEHFRRQRDDLHEPLGAQLARHRPEDTGTDRLKLVVQQHGGIAVELDQRTVGTTNTLGGTHHHGVVDIALLDATARRGIFHGDLHDVANTSVATLGTTKHLDAHHRTRTGVVGDVQPRLHLNHELNLQL